MAQNYARRESKDYNLFRYLFYTIFANCIFYPYYKIFYRLEVHGRENIPKGRSFIVAANHLSNLDPPLMVSVMGMPVAFMAKKELFKIPFIREVIDYLGAFAVDREKLEVTTIKTAKGILATKRWSLGMFPQGSRELPGKISRINQGFVYLAKSAGVGILPVGIIGSDKSTKIPFRGKIIVKIGKLLPVPSNMNEGIDQWANAVAELTGFEYSGNECNVSAKR